MEPFADYANIFRGFPGRNAYLDEGHTALVASLQERWSVLKRFKYPGFYQPGRPRALQAVDAALIRLHARIGAQLRFPSQVALRYNALNLNQRATTLRHRPEKDPTPSHEVIKELRLNFKVRFLRALSLIHI